MDYFDIENTIKLHSKCIYKREVVTLANGVSILTFIKQN